MSLIDGSTTQFLVTAGGLGLVLLLAAVLFAVWRKRKSGSVLSDHGRCGFMPSRVTLRGHRGDVLTANARVDGPMGLTFATYVEEPWVVVTPSSGILPQDAEIRIHTRRAPDKKRHLVTVRILPIDGNLACEHLQVDLRLKHTRENPVSSHL